MQERKVGFVAATLLLGSLAMPVLAQPAPDGGGQGQGDNAGGGRGGRGGFDPAQMRQRMEERVKEMLGASDDEFKAIQPKLEKVFQLQRDASGARGMMMLMGRGGRGGRGGDAAGPGAAAGGGPAGDQNATPSPLQQKAKELQETLDNKDAKPEEIKAKLDAYREARTKAKEELATAQKELRELLSQRQEATIVMLGMLD